MFTAQVRCVGLVACDLKNNYGPEMEDLKISFILIF